MIYLDHNGTSPPSESHLEKLFTQLKNCSGNPSSPHAIGRGASVALTQARRFVAQALGVDVSQLIFVSGASEANNIATIGVLRYLGVSSAHAIVSGIEHPAVLEPLQYLQKKEGLNLTVINPNTDGEISIAEIIKNITPDTNYIALMAANNEVGTIQQVQLLGDFLNFKRWGIKSAENFETILELEKYLSDNVTKENLQKLHFHVDAVQAFGKLKQSEWFSQGIDTCAISGHKVGALQGIGALFLRRGRQFTPLIFGGAQEKNRRAGTENLPGIVSFGIICEEMLLESWWNKVTQMNANRMHLYHLLTQFSSIRLNSPKENGLPNTIHFSVLNEKKDSKIIKKNKNGEDLLVELDLNGICASSGSACSSGANLPSQVLLAMGRSAEIAKSSIRLSLGLNTTGEEIELVANCMQRIFTTP